MKLTDLEIDGFGVWHDLKLNNLSPRVTTFYGANEAGKTTVMQFTRAVLYGISPGRRRRYLPPLNGGRPGGALGIKEGDVQFRVTRVAERGDDDVGRVLCMTPDGTTSADRLLREALGDVDEATFTNIFAVGLSEIQELGSLSGTKAAEWLYRLTSGLDRVSLYDVITTLRSNRRDLLGEARERSQIADLTARRDQLRSEIDRLQGRNRQWAQLAVEINEIDGQIAESERQVRLSEHAARTVEIAVGLKPNWRQREKVTEQLGLLTGRVRLPDDAIDRVNELNALLEKHQRQADVLQGQRHQLRDECERLGINELLVKNGCRIDALGEQRDWLASLDRQRDELEKEAREIEARLAGEQRRLAELLGLKNEKRLREITNIDLERLQPQIDALRSADKRLEAARREVDSCAESERSLQTQLESAIVGGDRHGLPMDLQEASDLVARLRRRLQVEQRLEQARQHELELEQQSHELLDDQVMPLWLFGWLLAAVILGGLMVGLSLLVPNSPLAKYGGLVALAGVGMGAFAFVFKYFTEDAAAERLDACHRQMETLARQITDADVEKQKIDVELPITDGSVVLRLQAAERHLAELENMLPVEVQRKQAGSEVANAETRLRQAERQRDDAVKQWQAATVALGLPTDLDPLRLSTVVDRLSLLGELETRAGHRREDAAARAREHDALLRRIDGIAEEVGCRPKSENAHPTERLEHLISTRRQQLASVERREELRERAKQLRLEEGKHRRALEGIKRRRAAIFQGAGCQDEQEYRMLAADQHQANLLANQLKGIQREIAAAMGKHAPEEKFAELLAPESIGQLEKMWEESTAALDSRQKSLKELAQRRGALQKEQEAIAADRALAEAQLDLGVVEVQLARACRSWREHAVVNRVLERIRADYETHRQPETLAEASKYMAKLTDGRYVRIWTPLANDILLVQNSEGDNLPVDVLSRGTREQLFLSVRLALVAMFARRGVNLPMVLDDVLVNCDEGRARRAAEVLCEFAAGGRQILIFTCHEHMWRMFQDMKADCRRLPLRKGLPEPSAALEERAPQPALVVEEPLTEHYVIEAVEPETPRRPLAPPPRRKKKRAAAPLPETPALQPRETPQPIELYDYPFVERLVEERVPVPAIEPSPWPPQTKLEPQSDFYEYSFDLEPHDVRPSERTAEDPAFTPLAYVVNDRPQAAPPARTAPFQRDHLANERRA